MNKDKFYNLLLAEVKIYKQLLETEGEEWKVKGFIDVDRNIYRTAGEAIQQDMGKPHYTDLESYLKYKRQSLKADSDLFGDLFKE